MKNIVLFHKSTINKAVDSKWGRLFPQKQSPGRTLELMHCWIFLREYVAFYVISFHFVAPMRSSVKAFGWRLWASGLCGSPFPSPETIRAHALEHTQPRENDAQMFLHIETLQDGRKPGPPSIMLESWGGSINRKGRWCNKWIPMGPKVSRATNYWIFLLNDQKPVKLYQTAYLVLYDVNRNEIEEPNTSLNQ